MRIVIAGGSGFLGGHLAERLAAVGHHVVVLTRRIAAQSVTPNVRYITWDPDGDAGGEWGLEVDGAGAVVNLAGAGLADKRWTADRKAELKDSRVLSTRSLVSAARNASIKPAVFVQASGAGYYGTDAGDRELDESFPPGSDFLSELAVLWEAEAHAVSALGTRLVIVRNGVVISRSGGALEKLALPFKMFVGGPIASGTQYLSWIHLDDWVELIVWAIDTPSVTGVINGTAPVPVTNQEFTAAIGRALKRPSWIRVPALALRALLGEMATPMLIRGQRVIPSRTQSLGYRFKHPTIDDAIRREYQ